MGTLDEVVVGLGRIVIQMILADLGKGIAHVGKGVTSLGKVLGEGITGLGDGLTNLYEKLAGGVDNDLPTYDEALLVRYCGLRFNS